MTRNRLGVLLIFALSTAAYARMPWQDTWSTPIAETACQHMEEGEEFTPSILAAVAVNGEAYTEQLKEQDDLVAVGDDLGKEILEVCSELAKKRHSAERTTRTPITPVSDQIDESD